MMGSIYCAVIVMSQLCACTAETAVAARIPKHGPRSGVLGKALRAVSPFRMLDILDASDDATDVSVSPF